MMEQIGIFDGASPLKITKPIRLIELFAGYGSQALALKYLGVPFEHHRICEWAVKSIQAYKDLHFPDDCTDYSAGIPSEKIESFLFERGISADYNKPMTREQIHRLGEKQQRKIYNNINATRNLVSVCACNAEDLAITDTDKYTYIMTYSFPCQDLSISGNMAGMEKGSGTRSGLLWEVERLLREAKNKPQILLMENVPEVIGKRNIKHFAEWLKFLESLGYKCYWKCLNAKDFSVPQNRNRCFMVSVLGDMFYNFPQPIHLQRSLKDILEETVDKKYFLSEKMIRCFIKHNEKQKEKCGGFMWGIKELDGIAATITTKAGSRAGDTYIRVFGHISSMREQNGRVYGTNGISPTLTTCSGGNQNPFILVNNATNKGHDKATIGDSINLDYPNSKTRRGRVGKGVSQTLTTSCNQAVVVPPTNGEMIRRLTPKECFRLMGVRDDDFEKIAKHQSDCSLYHLAGDSIVIDVLKAIFNKML